MGIWDRFVTWIRTIFMSEDEKMLYIAYKEINTYFEE